MAKTAVIALGGNALTRAGQPGTYDEMLANAAVMAAAVDEVIEAGWRVVIVHGNGPQVGNLALQQEATTMVPAQPLALLNAMTQGELGSVIACAIDLLRGPGTAPALLLVTAVDRVMLDYGTPKQSELGTITAAEAARYLDDGQFPPGSMGPKIESALRFLADGGELAVVTSPGLLAATLAGGQRSGTRIERSPSQNGPG